MCKEIYEMYHVLVGGCGGVVLPDTVVLDHLLKSFVEALGAQPLTPLALQLLLSLTQNICKSHLCDCNTYCSPAEVGKSQTIYCVN